MPNRIMREGILTGERVDAIADDPSAEVFYRRLYSVVDDFGRFSAGPSLLRAALYPLRLDKVSTADISRHLGACSAAGLVWLYEVDGKPYVELAYFNQRIRTKSKYPAPRYVDPSAAREAGGKRRVAVRFDDRQVAGEIR